MKMGQTLCRSASHPLSMRLSQPSTCLEKTLCRSASHPSACISLSPPRAWGRRCADLHPTPQHASLSALRVLAVIFFTPLLIRHLAWAVIKSGIWWSLEKLGQSPEESLVMTLKAISHLPSRSSYPQRTITI